MLCIIDIVSDVPGSLFTSVRVTQFSLTHLV